MLSVRRAAKVVLRQVVPRHRTSGCRFQRPKFWGLGVLTWLGRCQKGFAEGPGVIVNEVEGL